MNVNFGRNVAKRNAHPTKSGPGRRHADGEKHGKAPKADKGHFLGQHTNPERAQRRAFIKACGGVRQFKKIRAAHRSL